MQVVQSLCGLVHFLNGTSAPENVVQEVPKKIVPFVSSRQLLCQQICLIVMGIDISSSPFISGNPFSHKMVADTVTLLLQYRFWYGCVGQDRLVITFNVCRSFTWYPHHFELVFKSFKILTRLLHCDKFWPKATTFHTRLLLVIPIDQGAIQMH